MIATLERKPLGQLLLSRGFVKQEHLDRALEEQKRLNHQQLIGEVLVDLHLCSEDQIIETLAETYGVPYAKVSPRVADPKVVRLLPAEFLDKHTVLPLFLVEGTLTIAVPEPANVFLIEEIERLVDRPVQIVAATTRDIRATLQSYLPAENVFVIDDIIDDVRPEEFRLVERRIEPATNLERAAADSPVIKFVNYCIHNAIKDGASDIHFEPGEHALRVRYRIDGRLTEKLRPPYQMSAAIASRIKIIAGLEVAERRLPQDGEIHVQMRQRPVELRVSTMPGKYGEKIVIRIVDEEKAGANLEKLGFGYETLKQWRKLLALPNGILLVTGPSGGGKTATLYASLRELNKEDANLCTVEDPVAGALEGANQFEVNEKIGFTFPAALRSVLRQEPDVVMIGELRDPETTKIATQAALTGHLILSTLHTNDAPSAVVRLIHLGVEPYLVGASLCGVLAQRLVRKLCQSCKEPYAPTLSERRHLEKFGAPVDTLYRPTGCPRCRNLGYFGQVGVYELLVIEDTLAERISQGAALAEIRQIAGKLGAKTLRADGMEKVKAGITTLEEVYRVTS